MKKQVAKTPSRVKPQQSVSVPRESPIRDSRVPMVDPDFLIIERDPGKLHAYARGLLDRLRKPSRSYPIKMVETATVWLISAYVDAQIPLPPEMSALIAGVVRWDRRASTFRKVREINEPAYWAAIQFEASKPADPKGIAPSVASLYSVARHVLGVGLPLQGTRRPKAPDSEPDPAWPQKSAEGTLRGWRKIDHYQENVRLLRNLT